MPQESGVACTPLTTSCPAGHALRPSYYPEYRDNTCRECYEGRWRAAGTAETCTHKTCSWAAGQYIDSADWSDRTRDSVCRDCPSGTFTLASGTFNHARSQCA